MAKGPSSVNEEGQPGVDPGNAVWNRKVLGVRVRGWAGARAGLFADMHVREEMKEPKDTKQPKHDGYHNHGVQD